MMKTRNCITKLPDGSFRELRTQQIRSQRAVTDSTSFNSNTNLRGELPKTLLSLANNSAPVTYTKFVHGEKLKEQNGLLNDES
jgi:hypothetical protein